DRFGVGGGRCGVRHLKHAGDAAQGRAARAASQIFLLRIARLAEMHLRVAHAGQYVQALGFKNRPRGTRDVAAGDVLASAHADVALALAGRADDPPAGQDQIKTRHRKAPAWSNSSAAAATASMPIASIAPAREGSAAISCKLFPRMARVRGP